MVLKILQNNKLQLIRKKWEFKKQQLVYLGFIVGGGRLKVDTDKVKAIMNGLNLIQ